MELIATLLMQVFEFKPAMVAEGVHIEEPQSAS